MVRVHAEPVTRESDGRRFYLVEAGPADAPRHMAVIDRDLERICDGCGLPFLENENVLGIGDLTFHPTCAPAMGDA